MPVIDVIIIAVVVVLLVLVVVGALANRRRRQAEDLELRERALVADRHLAQAVAEDKGWERATLEQAAREAFSQRHGHAPQELMLIKVLDMPGVDADEAVFAADGQEIALSRRGGSWSAV
jgi:hypothetical protein